MGKKSATRRNTGTDGGPPSSSTAADVPVVGMREPCPCGSGRRYKACHGRSATAVFVGPARPFEGLASECDMVAMREIVPAASAPLTLLGEHADREVTLATVLPMAWPALVRADGSILLGLQVNVGSGDASRDLADALLGGARGRAGRARRAGPGRPPSRPRLQDLLDPDVPLDITVHDSFEFWVDGAGEISRRRARLARAGQRVRATRP